MDPVDLDQADDKFLDSDEFHQVLDLDYENPPGSEEGSFEEEGHECSDETGNGYYSGESEDNEPLSKAFKTFEMHSQTIFACSFNRNKKDDTKIRFMTGGEDEKAYLITMKKEKLIEELKEYKFIDNVGKSVEKMSIETDFKEDTQDECMNSDGGNRINCGNNNYNNNHNDNIDEKNNINNDNGHFSDSDFYKENFFPINSDDISIIELSGHSDSIINISCSFDGNYIATGSMDGKIKIWDFNSGELINTLVGPTESIESICWHPHLDIILGSSSNGEIFMWKVSRKNPGGFPIGSFYSYSGSVNKVLFNSTGNQICGVFGDGSLQIWSAKRKTLMSTIKIHDAPINCVGIDSESVVAITGGQDNLAKITNIKNQKIKSTLTGHTDSIEEIHFAKSYPWIITGSLDCRIGIWDMSSATLRQWIENGNAGITCIQSIDPNTIIASDVDGYVKIWDIRSATLVSSIRAHKGTILQFDYLADLNILLTSSDTENVAKLFSFPV